MLLLEQVDYLLRSVRSLACLGMDGVPVHAGELSCRHDEIYRLSTSLYDSFIVHSSLRDLPLEEQAHVCLALLTGYSITFIDHGEKQSRIRELLNLCWPLLDNLPASLLKLRLLTACYGEVYDDTLAADARAVISSWDTLSLTPEQQEAVEAFRNVVESPCPWEYVEAV